MSETRTYDFVKDDLAPEAKRANWEVAFGLQKVDELEPSRYMRDLAKAHIEGERSYAQVSQEISRYYQEGGGAGDAPERTEEADIVADAIYGILADEAFRFDIPTLKSYHRRLFEQLDTAVYYPGEFRTVNLTKKEPVLDGRSVQYQDYGVIEESLAYDFEEERKQDYLAMDFSEKVARLATFISRIWQVHPFYEGNTRTTAVFIEKYLMSMGYKIDNELLGQHAREFRDALVLANYTNIPEGIKANPGKLQEFVAEMLRQ